VGSDRGPATALLVAGGKQALTALQAMSIATGLIYTVLMCVACLALWRALQVEAGDLHSRAPSFSISVLDPFFTNPYREMMKKHVLLDNVKLLVGFFRNLFIAPLSVARASMLVVSPTSFYPVLGYLSTSLILFVAFHLLNLAVPGCWALAWICFIAHGSGVAMVRMKTRNFFAIPGHPLEDLCLGLLLYPSVALQLEHATREVETLEIRTTRKVGQ